MVWLRSSWLCYFAIILIQTLLLGLKTGDYNSVLSDDVSLINSNESVTDNAQEQDLVTSDKSNTVDNTPNK